MEKDDEQNPKNVSKFAFSKTIVDLDLLKRGSINELSNYINSEDVELNRVKILMKKANRELKIDSRQLFIRKSPIMDKEVENRICITRR